MKPPPKLRLMDTSSLRYEGVTRRSRRHRSINGRTHDHEGPRTGAGSFFNCMVVFLRVMRRISGLFKF